MGSIRGPIGVLLVADPGIFVSRRSANMALALEPLGWGTADHWMRMQASYELAQARKLRAWR